MIENIKQKIVEMVENASGDQKLNDEVKTLFVQLSLEMYERGFLDGLDAVDYSVNKMRINIMK